MVVRRARSLVLIFLLIMPQAYAESVSTTITPLEEIKKTLATQYRSKEASRLKKAYDALKKNRWDSALQLTEPLIPSQNSSDLALWIRAQARLRKSSQLVSAKKYSLIHADAKKALQELSEIVSKTPYSPFIKSLPRMMASAELLLGSAAWGKKNWSASQQDFEKAFYRLNSQNYLIDLTPDHLSHYAESCKKKPGPFCALWLDKFLNQFVKKSPESLAITQYFPDPLEGVKPSPASPRLSMPYKAPDLDTTAYPLAIQNYFDGKYSKAAQELQGFLDTYPKSSFRYRARYWKAQALIKDQDQTKAQALLEGLQKEAPLTYYGLLASFDLGQPLESALNRAPLQWVSEEKSLLVAERIHLRRAQELLAVKAEELAAFELREIRARESHSNEFLTYLILLNTLAKNTSHSLALLTEMAQRGGEGFKSAQLLDFIFPTEYFERVQKESEPFNVDPILILSLMKQESAFQEDAGSSVGALGLMQLMPATALQTNSQVWVSQLITADQNLPVGIAYLKKLIDRFNGNLVYALAGYNAGPNAVDRWIKATDPKKSMSEFIELIPYRETREYVGSIIRNYYWYTRRLKGKPLESLEIFWKSNADFPKTNPSPQAPSNLEDGVKPQNENA